MKLLKDCKDEVILALSWAFGEVKLAVADTNIRCLVTRTSTPLQYQILVFINGSIDVRLGFYESEKVKAFWRPKNLFSYRKHKKFLASGQFENRTVYLSDWTNPKTMVTWMLRHNPEIKVTDIGLDHPVLV